MPRQATGSVRHRGGRWLARVTLGPNDRPSFPLPSCKTEEAARERLAVLVDIATRLRAAGHIEVARPLLERAAERNGRALADVLEAVERICEGNIEVPCVIGTTFQSFAEDWTEGRLHKKWPDQIREKSSHKDDRQRLVKHVFPIVGHVAVAEFNLDHADAVMRALPRGLAPATRRHVAQVMHRVLGLAVYPARLRVSNPLPKGFLPSPKSQRAFSYLYPGEDAQLLACAAVPLEHRLLWGFLAREGMRTSEAERLTWSAVDLERGAITLDENKTKHPRAWVLDPGVTRALTIWKGMLKSTKPANTVFSVPMKRLAEELREHLALAGVDRPTLFERTASRQPIRAHDLRATMITVSLANGRTETWVQDRTGHTSSVMINRYRRAARSLAELNLGPLLPLDEAIAELRRARQETREPSLRA